MSSRIPLAVACLALLFPAAAHAAVAPPQVSPVSSTITALPAGAVRTKLLKQFNAVTVQVKANQLCTARSGLTKLRAAALAHGAAPAASQAAIAATSLQAESALLARPATKSCGGDVPAAGDDATLHDTGDDDAGVTLHLAPPATSFSPEVAGGSAAVTAAVGDLDPHGAAFGDPEVSTTTTLVAVPRGDTLALNKVTARSYTFKNVPLAPYEDTGGAQLPFYDTGDYAPQPFTRSAKFNGVTPGRVVTLGREFNFRGTMVVPVTVSATRYNGASRSLQVFSSIDVGLSFKGGGTTFGPSWAADASNAQFTVGIANLAQLVKSLAPPPTAPGQSCPEMLLIADQAYINEANALAVHKDQIGIPTRVLTTATLTNQAKIHAAIMATLTNSVNHCARGLGYVLFLGSTTAIPPYLRHSTRNSAYTPLIATDYPYFVPTPAADQTFAMPELCYGRLAARSEFEAQEMVAKIITYENSPPTSAYFIGHTSVAGMFQYSTASHPDPTRESNEFIKPLELIRNRMTALGKSVDRYYVKEDGANPKFYSDGSPLPGGLTWNATPEQVALAINEGRSVVFHDDHGYEDGSGWGSPGFGNDSISLLHNADLPFVVSVDCDSGDFQNAAESFAERMEDYNNGGSIGVIAASRMTNTGANVDYSLAVASALYGGLIPGESGASQYPAMKTMGDVLFSAQWRFNVTQGSPGAAVAIDYRRQYNLFGDPSLALVK